MKKPLLRIALPRLHTLAPSTPVGYAVIDRDGCVRETGEMPVESLDAHWMGYTVHALLHPADVALASMAAPPLSGSRLTAAISSLSEPLILGDLSSVVLAHGPRGADEHVPIAWAERAAFDRARQIFEACHVTVSAYFPAPFFLPLDADGWTACIAGDHVVARTGPDTGFIQPLGEHDTIGQRVAPGTAVFIETVVQAMPAQLAWVGSVPSWWPQVSPIPLKALPYVERWRGPTANWPLILLHGALPAQRPWHAPAAWMAAAAVLWMVGLNLYAARLAHEGHALEARMAQRVKEAFPSVSVVLDPLQQARRQRDARIAAAARRPDEDFASLLRRAAGALALAPGQVREMRYAQGEVTIQFADPEPASAAHEPSWMPAARQAGLSVAHTGAGWRIRRAEAAAGPEVETHGSAGQGGRS